MLLRGLERIGTDDGLARIVAIAIAPGGGARRIVTNRCTEDRAALHLQSFRTVAAEVARVLPQLAVLVEVLGGEEIDRQRLHPGGCRAVPGGAELERRLASSRRRRRATQRKPHGTDERIAAQLLERALQFLGFREREAREFRARQRDRKGCAAPDALEAGVRDLLRHRHAAQEERGERAGNAPPPTTRSHAQPPTDHCYVTHLRHPLTRQCTSADRLARV